MKRMLTIALMLLVVTAFASWAQSVPSAPTTTENCSGWTSWLRPSCHGNKKTDNVASTSKQENTNKDLKNKKDTSPETKESKSSCSWWNPFCSPPNNESSAKNHENNLESSSTLNILDFIKKYKIPIIVVFISLLLIVLCRSDFFNKVLSDKTKLTIAMLCMFWALCILIVIPHEIVTTGFWPWPEEKTHVIKIMPDLITTLCSIILILPFFIRNSPIIMEYANNAKIPSFLLALFDVIFTASMLSVFFSVKLWKLPFLGEVKVQVLVLFAILMSWFGMRSVSVFVWTFLLILSMFRLANINNALGLWGPCMLLLALTSIVFQLILSKDVLRSIILKSEFIYRQPIALPNGNNMNQNQIESDVIDAIEYQPAALPNGNNGEQASETTGENAESSGEEQA